MPALADMHRTRATLHYAAGDAVGTHP